MKLYKLNLVKLKVIQNSIDKEEQSIQNLKFQIKKYYHIDVLEKLGINKIYMSTEDLDFNFYLTEDQIKKINLFAKLNSGFNLSFDNLPFKEINKYQEFEYSNKNDLPKITTIYKELDKIKDLYFDSERNQRKTINKERVEKFGKINNSIEGKKIISIDFEFNPNNIIDKYDLSFISEIGITTNFNGNIDSKHFIIDENKKSKSKELGFLYGETQSITTNDIKKILNNELKNAEVLILHSFHAELNFLIDNSIEHSHLDILDIQILYKNYIDNENEDLKKLSKILQGLKIDYGFLHNAGNDAYYTHEAFIKILDKINVKNKNTFKIK